MDIIPLVWLAVMLIIVVYILLSARDRNVCKDCGKNKFFCECDEQDLT